MLVPGQTQEELTRLPILWHHYQLHKSQHPQTGLSAYFQLHYGKDFAQHRGAHDHSKLPMKGGDNHVHVPVPIDIPKDNEVRLKAITPNLDPAVFEDQILSQSFLSDIWQPPRNC